MYCILTQGCTPKVHLYFLKLVQLTFWCSFQCLYFVLFCCVSGLFVFCFILSCVCNVVCILRVYDINLSSLLLSIVLYFKYD